jgi:putative ATP-binding cassette transporter
MMERHRLPLDRLAFSRWRRAIVLFIGSPEAGKRAKFLIAALLALLLAVNGLNVLNSYVGRDFMTAIEVRSMPRFVAKAVLYIGVFAASTAVAVVYRFAEERLGLLWRDWLTKQMVRRYLQEGRYYWLREQEIANPDQRIAEDVRIYTATTISLALVLLNASFTIVAFSGVMWSISPLLFGTAVAYAALGSGLTVLFGRPLIWLNYDQADREAALRADLVHLRENAESVAMLRREGRIRERLLRRVDELIANSKRIIAVNRNLGFFTTGYNYLIQIIPALIVAPLFIRSEVEFGVITQSSMAFSHLLGAFSLVVTQFQQISGYAVVLTRLSALGEGMNEATARHPGSIKVDDGGQRLEWHGLSLYSQHNGDVLLRSLTLSVQPGSRLLVSGPNEAACSALFRASAGVWRAGDGRIVRPPIGAIQFVPERPYLPPGTLREALLRTEAGQDVDEVRIVSVLRAVGIEDAVARAGGLGTERDWDDLLSLAEQQRIAFARVLLAAPRFAVLDRPGTVVGTDAVAHILDLLATQSITVVTFAPEDTLAADHDLRLVIETDGTWQVQPIRVESRTA